MPLPLINGQTYAWSDIELSIMGVVVTGVTEIDYESDRESKLHYGAGSEPISYAYGTLKCKGGVTLAMSALDAIREVAPLGDITLCPPFPIIVSFVNAVNKIVTHKLLGCMFTNDGMSAKHGDTNIEKKLNLLIGKIIYK
jgi:hypothetical protein